MATLVAHRLAAEGFPVRAVYTYGSPRPGDRNFRDAYRRAQLPLRERQRPGAALAPAVVLSSCRALEAAHARRQIAGSRYSDWKDKKRQLVKHAKHVQRAHRNDEDPPLKLGEFDWLADHHLGGYLDGIARLLPRVPRRRHPEYAGIELDAVPLHYIDEPAEPIVRRPKMLDAPARVPGPRAPGDPPAPAITQSELAAAFSKQPRSGQSGPPAKISEAFYVRLSSLTRSVHSQARAPCTHGRPDVQGQAGKPDVLDRRPSHRRSNDYNIGT